MVPLLRVVQKHRRLMKIRNGSLPRLEKKDQKLQVAILSEPYKKARLFIVLWCHRMFQEYLYLLQKAERLQFRGRSDLVSRWRSSSWQNGLMQMSSYILDAESVEMK